MRVWARETPGPALSRRVVATGIGSPSFYLGSLLPASSVALPMAQRIGHTAQHSPGGLTPLAQPQQQKQEVLQNAKATCMRETPKPHPLSHKNNTSSDLTYTQPKPQKIHKSVFFTVQGECRAQGWVPEPVQSRSPIAGRSCRNGF